MSKCLLRVREDDGVTVYTEHTDRIHPRDLSDSLARKVGKDRFRVSLRKNIYIIYIDAKTHEPGVVSTMYVPKDHTNKEK